MAMPDWDGVGKALAKAPKIHFGLVALVLVGLVAVPPFRNPGNLVNVVDQSAALAILALGQSFVIAGGLIDLSVGQLVGLVTVVACALIGTHPDLAWLIIPGVVAGAALVGLVNGELVNRLKISPLILTFGMLSILQGAIFIITDRSIGSVDPAIAFLANGRIAGLPVSLLLVAVVAVGAWLLLERSLFGWHLLALGNSAESTRRAGIAIPRLVRLAFVLSGLSAGLAGLIVAGRLGTGYPNAGDGMELDAIVAVVLGGTPLKGGKVSVVAILSAVLVLGVLNNILNLLQVPTFTQILVKGLIVIGAILADRPARLARA
jgi:ribose/xylose/arabinose/galactoside ABC-type transport system permease subunit